MNSVSFIFHTVKMTWPSFPQKSKYLQSVFNSRARHKFSINTFWIENCDFILVILWKKGFSLDQLECSQQKRFLCCLTRSSGVTFCLWCCGPLASVSPAQPPMATVLPLSFRHRDNRVARGGRSPADEACLWSRALSGPWLVLVFLVAFISLCRFERVRRGWPFPVSKPVPHSLLLNLKEQWEVWRSWCNLSSPLACVVLSASRFHRWLLGLDHGSRSHPRGPGTQALIRRVLRQGFSNLDRDSRQSHLLGAASQKAGPGL